MSPLSALAAGVIFWLACPSPQGIIPAKRKKDPRFQCKETFDTEIPLFVHRTMPTGAAAARVDADRWPVTRAAGEGPGRCLGGRSRQPPGPPPRVPPALPPSLSPPLPTPRLRPASAGISSCSANIDSGSRELSYPSSGCVRPPGREKTEAESGSGTRATPRELQRTNTEDTDMVTYQGLGFLCACTRTSLRSPDVWSEGRSRASELKLGKQSALLKQMAKLPGHTKNWMCAT